MDGLYFFFFSSRRRHTRCADVTGVQTCALPILVDSSNGGYEFPAEAHNNSLNLVVFCGFYEITGGDNCAETGFLDRLSLLSPPPRPRPIADREPGTG